LFLIAVILLNILLLGILFGSDSVVGFSIGMILVGTHIILEHILKSQKMSNSKQYLEVNNDDFENNNP